MLVNCPTCNRTLRKPPATMVTFADGLLGIHLTCPDCGETFAVWFAARPSEGTLNDSTTIVPSSFMHPDGETKQEIS